MGVTASLYIVILVSAFLAGSIQLQAMKTDMDTGQPARQLPKATLVLFLLIAGTTSLQFFYPVVLTTLERDYRRFLAGDWWRVVTALFVQDGGIFGSIFNLVSLILVGSVAERLWGSWRWVAIFFGSGVVTEIIAFAWQPIGAGNSIANFGLAASIGVMCLAVSTRRRTRVVASVALIGGVILLLFKDIHGAATMVGASISLSLLWKRVMRTED